MNESEIPRQEVDTLRERIAALSAAILRIHATLDVTTVLQEVVDSARVLTGARYGVITTIDQAGEVQEFVSSGFTAEEHREFADWPDGPLLWAHLRDLPGPVRLTDLPAFVRSLRLLPGPDALEHLPGYPMRHRDEQVGNLFLAEKENAAEFSDEDERVLELFASLAADGDRQLPYPPRRAARARRPGGAGGDLTGRRGGVRCRERAPGVVQSRSAAHHGAPAHPPAGRWKSCRRS